MNWILILVLGILIVNGLIGLKAGFIKTIFSLLSMIVALMLTSWLSPMVNQSLQKNDKIHGYITDKVETMLSLEEEKTDIKDQEEFIESLPLPKSFRDTLIEQKDAKVSDLKAYITSYVTGVIINSLAFFLTFIVIMIALWILCFALNIISKLPILNQINKLAGLIVGLMQGLIVVWILFVLLTVFGGSNFGQQAFILIEESKILSIIYNNNLLLSIVANAAKLLK